MRTTHSFVMVTAAAMLTAIFSAGGASAADHHQGPSHMDGHGKGGQAHDNNHGVNRNHNGHRSLHFRGFGIYRGDNGGCGPSYRRWQETGSRYWRDRYYACRNG
ncbi:MAG: hypothetical protein WC807_02115 [Hyphomicrobium sp.]|jgi:hypothetical protein